MTLFPEGVVLYFLEKGHSYIAPDRVVSHCRKSFKGKDLYIPQHLVDCMNSIKNVTAEHLDYTADNRFMFEGWEDLFTCCLHRIPYLPALGGYTKSLFFDIRNGLLNIRSTHDSPILYTHAFVTNTAGDYTEEASRLCGAYLQGLIFLNNKSFETATTNDIRLRSEYLLNVYMQFIYVNITMIMS